ncbi:MAG: S46 family peptidase [Xanthomonadales bacterium]|nr:S46 family peptidase [Xanthomonadales bacterium]MDH4001782.1 S46 family peptidase [Xanthomonadales bacterium]
MNIPRAGKRLLLVPFTSVLLLTSTAGFADEGMWTLHDFPTEAVKTRHGVTIGEDWLNEVQRSTARLDGGCTGSFASAQGLVLTNNHCTWGCIRDLSTEDKNLSNEGFLASTREEELQCPGARVSVLHETEEITTKIHAATAGKPEKEANEERKALLSRLEAECEESGTLSCESVNLYHGGQYFLYKYKRYDDVRLVFSPELAVAAYGGDPDNFNFPRWNLDMSFLRVYEDGKPAVTPDFFPWYAAGAAAGEAVFVSGHPGSTDRLLTTTELAFRRSHYLPLMLVMYAEYRGRMLEWAQTSESAARQVQQRILGIENAIKVWKNQLRSLMDEEQIARKMQAELELKEAVMANPELAEAYGSAWQDAERAIASYKGFFDRYRFIEVGQGFQGQLFDWAHTLVRGTREIENPNEERLRAYRDTALPRVEQGLFAATPADPGYGQLGLGFSLDKMREWLGPDDEVVRAVLGNESPRAMAERLITGSQLADADFRKKLWEGGSAAVQASDDPMIVLARQVEPYAMELRRRYDDEVEAPLKQASEKIAKARFAILGKNVYPDATFTLRVTFGAVDGWMEKGEQVVPFTRIGRAFERATGEDPFRMPDSWLEAKDRINLDTPYNFSSTTDIIGGNSGSPVINARGELVGLAFDGNIHSIAGDFWFDERLNRTVSVHVAAMLEALKVVYGADHLAEELVIKR